MSYNENLFNTNVDAEMNQNFKKVLRQCYDEVHCQLQDRRIKNDVSFFFTMTNSPLSFAEASHKL